MRVLKRTIWKAIKCWYRGHDFGLWWPRAYGESEERVCYHCDKVETRACKNVT